MRLPAVAPLEHGRRPGEETVVHDPDETERAHEGHVEPGTRTEDLEALGQSGPLRETLASVRLADQQQEGRQDDADEADDEEHRLPGRSRKPHLCQVSRGVAGEGDHTAPGNQREARAEIGPGAVNGQRATALFGPEAVREQRICAGRKAGLAHPDGHATQKEPGERIGEAAAGGREAPADEPADDQVAPVPPIGDQPEGDAEQRIEKCKGKALQEAELRIRDVQVRSYRLDQQAQDLPVDERAGVREHQQDQRRPCRTQRRKGNRRGNRSVHALYLHGCTPWGLGVHGTVILQNRNRRMD